MGAFHQGVCSPAPQAASPLRSSPEQPSCPLLYAWSLSWEPTTLQPGIHSPGGAPGTERGAQTASIQITQERHCWKELGLPCRRLCTENKAPWAVSTPRQRPAALFGAEGPAPAMGSFLRPSGRFGHSADVDHPDFQGSKVPAEGWSPIWEGATSLPRYQAPPSTAPGHPGFQVTQLTRARAFPASLLHTPSPTTIQPHYF